MINIANQNGFAKINKDEGEILFNAINIFKVIDLRKEVIN